MRKAKKKKVQAREDATYDALTACVTNEDAENVENESTAQPAPASHARLALSPGGVKRQAAEAELDELAVEFEVLDELHTEAEKEFRMHQRLYDAKMARLDEAQRRKRKANPFNELERIYKAEMELLQARLKCAEAEASAHNAEAN